MFSISLPQYYYAHQMEHRRVGPVIVERDEDRLLANLDASIDEHIIPEENESKEKLFRCVVCSVTYEAAYDIRQHVRQVHVYKMFARPVEPLKEFICDICGRRYKSKESVKNHLMIHTNPHEKKHACTICGKTFRHKSEKQRHEQHHTGEVEEEFFLDFDFLVSFKKNFLIFILPETVPMPRMR